MWTLGLHLKAFINLYWRRFIVKWHHILTKVPLSFTANSLIFSFLLLSFVFHQRIPHLSDISLISNRRVAPVWYSSMNEEWGLNASQEPFETCYIYNTTTRNPPPPSEPREKRSLDSRAFQKHKRTSHIDPWRRQRRLSVSLHVQALGSEVCYCLVKNFSIYFELNCDFSKTFLLLLHFTNSTDVGVWQIYIYSQNSV